VATGDRRVILPRGTSRAGSATVWFPAGGVGVGPTALREALVLSFLLQLTVIGLIAGALARLILPGRDPIGCLGTIVLGMVGSFIGGFLGFLLFGRNLEEGAIQPSGLFGSIVGAVIALLIWRRVSRRSPRPRP
jgi:uncharacterized membrane protein YeaQ/YmgE (transglycosylase-associated protein family)